MTVVVMLLAEVGGVKVNQTIEESESSLLSVSRTMLGWIVFLSSTLVYHSLPCGTRKA